MSFNAIITADVRGLETGVDKAGQAIDKLAKTASEKIAAIGKSFENAGRKASILSAGLVAAGAKAYLMAADIEDAVGATEQIFKENADSVNAWAANLDSSFGIAKKEALEYSNLMGSMLINIGKLTEEQASKQSAKLIELAGDLTAMYGGSTQDAVRALTGALKGNNTMLDNYGMAVNESLIKTKALELGLMDTGGEMTLQAKQAATLALIWEQTGAAQGQAAREADGASGTMRALRTEIINLTTELGDVLLPVITPVITRVRDFVSGFRDLSPEAKKMIVVVAGVVAAIGPFLLILGKVIAIAPAVGAAVTAMTGPIGVIVMAIGAAVAAIIHYWDDIKAYFTEGPGASTFTSISEAATKVKDVLIKVFTTIKDVVTKIWDKFGGYITGAFSAVFDTIKAIIDWFVEQIGNVADFFSAIVDLDFSGALDALGKIFTSTFNGILRIVTNIIGQAANIVAGLFDAIGMDKWAAKTKGFADNMIAAYQPVVEETEKATEETEKYAKAQREAATAAERTAVAAERTAVAVATIARESNIDPIVGAGITMLEVEPVVVPPIDYDPYAQSLEEMNAITLDYGGLIASGLSDFASSIGEAFAEGNFEGLGSGLLGAMGGMISQFGAMLISAGVAAVALKKLIINPLTAIAAGAALVALGAAATASAQATVNKATGGGGSMGGSMGGTNSYNKTSSLGDSSYRGAYRDEWDSEVVFRIGNNELVGTLERANTRRERL